MAGLHIAAGWASPRVCPFCGDGPVMRMWLADLGLDSCECHRCWARWEEAPDGAYRGRVSSAATW